MRTDHTATDEHAENEYAGLPVKILRIRYSLQPQRIKDSLPVPITNLPHTNSARAAGHKAVPLSLSRYSPRPVLPVPRSTSPAAVRDLSRFEGRRHNQGPAGHIGDGAHRSISCDHVASIDSTWGSSKPRNASMSWNATMPPTPRDSKVSTCRACRRCCPSAVAGYSATAGCPLAEVRMTGVSPKARMRGPRKPPIVALP